MSSFDDFQADLEKLPHVLKKKYTLIGDLDKSLQEVQRENEQNCEQEIEAVKQRCKSGKVTPDSSIMKFSDEMLDGQKHALRIADEKVELAVQAYDLVDAQIQQLDQYLKKFAEELKLEGEDTAAAGGAPVKDTKAKSGKSGQSSKRVRKK